MVNKKKVSTASEAINAVLQEVGLNAPTFAKNIGVNYQRVYDIQAGRVKKINSEIVRKIREKYPRVNPNFLYDYEYPVMMEPGAVPTPQPESVNDMVDVAVQKIMATEEYQNRISNISNREKKVLEREERLQSMQENIQKQMLNLSEREKMLRAKEEELLHLERSIMTREMNILRRENYLNGEDIKKSGGVQTPFDDSFLEL